MTSWPYWDRVRAGDRLVLAPPARHSSNTNTIPGRAALSSDQYVATVYSGRGGDGLYTSRPGEGGKW